MPSIADVVFLGFYLSECSLQRKAGSLPEKVRLGIRNFDLSSDNEQIAINYKIELIDGSESSSVLIYQALFKLNQSTDFFDKFDKVLKDNIKELSPELMEILIPMIQYSFPYVRNGLSVLTNDLGGQINLPLIDCLSILKGPMEFLRQQ